MPITYIQEGAFIDHIPAANVPFGSVVVLGSLLGIAYRGIAAGTIGSLALEGVWEMPAVGGQHADAGVPVFWNPATSLATLDGAVPGVLRAGVLVRPLADADDRLRVLINR